MTLAVGDAVAVPGFVTRIEPNGGIGVVFCESGADTNQSGRYVVTFMDHPGLDNTSLVRPRVMTDDTKKTILDAIDHILRIPAPDDPAKQRAAAVSTLSAIEAVLRLRR